MPQHANIRTMLSYFCALGVKWLVVIVSTPVTFLSLLIVSFWSLLFPLFFLRFIDEPFPIPILWTSTLGSSHDNSCIPSLVASNIQPMPIAVSRVRLLFSKQRSRTISSSDLRENCVSRGRQLGL